MFEIKIQILSAYFAFNIWAEVIFLYITYLDTFCRAYLVSTQDRVPYPAIYNLGSSVRIAF